MKKIIKWICIFIIYFFSSPIVAYSEIDRLALPQGGNVVSGKVNINYAALDRLNVNQTSNQAIVNWQSFNVGRDASVHFNQPVSKASILNNVLSGRSIINGSIYSNGRLFLVNPTGILTGPHSAIKAEGAVLSTLNLSKQNYLNNSYQFNTNSNSSLVNQGLIEGQYVALIAPQVNNKGTIITSAATTIAAGDDVLLGISDSNNLTVKVSPSKLQAMAKNEGTIKTQNGIVTIKTDAAQSLVDEVVKLPNAKADGLVSENGVIKLVSNSGSIKAKKIKIDAGSKGAAEISGNLNSNNENGIGGTIEITGKDIDVNSATITANGQTGGGKVLIGGDWQGSGDLLQATYLDIDSNSKITANALTSGSGGTIVAWSDIKNSNSLTRVSGTLEAKGIDGNGGQIETSGAVLDINGIKVSTSSVTGSYGNWLVDPTNLTIDASAASTYVTNLASSDVTLTADNTITLSSNLAYTGARDSTLTFNATTTVLDANITSANGSLSLDINTILEIGASNTSISTNGGNVDISGVIRAVSGETSNNFTINAGAGNVTFSSNVVKQAGDYSAGFTQGSFTNESDLDFSGTFLNAINIAGNAVTIGDATFQRGHAGYNTSNSNESFQNQITSWSATNWSSSGLTELMRGIRWSGGTGHSPYVQFTNATAGQKYKIQALFKERCCNRYFDVYVDGTKIVDDFKPQLSGGNSGSTGRYLTYQFEASSSNVMFRMSGRTSENSGSRLHGNDVNPILNAISIEAVNAGAAINNLSITANQFSAQAIEVSGDLTVTNSGNSTISGVISGDTALTKAGSGQLTTSANNTYTGGTTVSAGTLFGGAGSRTNDVFGTGSISVASGATLWVDRSDDGALTNALTLNGGTLYGTNGFGQYWDGNITLGAHSTINAANNFYIDGVISGSSKNLTKTGTGTVILRGTNTYSGTTTVSAGTLNIGGSGSLGSGTYAGNISNSGTFTYASSTAQTLSGVISGSGELTKSGSSTLTLSGTNTYSGDTTISAGAITVSGLLGNGSYAGAIANSGTLTLSSSSAQTLSGVISGSGGITKSGSGNLTLSGNNTTTGTISLSSGNLIAGSDNALGSAPTISASNTPTLKTSDGVTLPSLEVTGDIILETSIATTGAQIYNNDVQIKGTGYSLTSSGSNITISGDVAAWSNTGILQLRYNGSYIFNGGSAATASASSSTVGNGSLTYASGSYTWTKPSSTTSADLLIIAGGGGGGGSNVGGGGGAGGVIQKTSYSLGSSTYSVTIGAGGAAGNAHYDGGNGGNTIFGSLTAIGGGGGGGHSNRPHGKSGGSGGGASFWHGNPGSGTSGQGYSGAQETTGRNRGGGGGGAGGPGGQLNGEGTNGGIGIQSSITGTAQWYAGGGGAGTDGATGNTYGGLIGGSGVGGDGGAARRAGNAATAHTGSGGGGGGGHSSNKGGAGASGLVVISYSQASSADLTINAAGAVTLSGAVSDFDFVNITNGETSSVAGVINGSGPLTKSGAGMLSLAGTNTYTGNTIINAGTLRLSGSGSIGSGTYAGTITNNGIFRSASSTAQTLSGVISGTGRVDASGNSGALTLTGTNTYSGGARVASGGILVAGSAGALGTDNSVRSLSTSDQFSVSSGVTLSSLRVTGAVRLNSGITTTGAQTYTSDVVVASGTRASPVEFNTTNSNITFGGTLKGEGNSKARSITIDAGTGDLEFGDRVGYAFNNETFDANNTADSFYKMTVTAGTTTIKGDIMTYEEQTYNSNINIGSTGSNGLTRTLLSMDPKVIINGNVNDTVANRHTLVAKAIAVRRDGQTPGTPDVTYNGTIGQTKKLAGYSGATGYQVVSTNYGTIDTGESFGTVTGGTQRNGKIGGSGNGNGSQSNKRRAQKSANAVVKNAKTTITDAGKNLIATLFGGGPSGGGRTFSKSIEVVMPGDAGFNKPGPQSGSGANIDADFSSPGNNQSSPSFEPRGNNSISGAPKTNTQGGNFSSINQGSGSSKPRSIKELFSSRDFKNQFGSRKEMRQFKREFRQQLRQNPGSRKSFNKALRQGMDPMDPKTFENATPEQRKTFDEFRKRATPEEQKAFRKFKDGEEDPRKSLDKSNKKMDRKGKDNKKLEDDDDKKKKDGNAKAN